MKILRKNFRTSISWALIILINLATYSHACTTMLIGKQATAEGQTIIARTSDTVDVRRAKNLKIYYDKDSLKSYIGLPYWDTEEDEHNDMSQVTTNANGVSLSATQTIRSNPTVMNLDYPSDPEHGVSEANIPKIIMPYATSARNGVDLLGSAIEKKGLANMKGFGVLFADKKEAWYLETLSGHQWVAIKIPEEVYFIAANGPGQIQEYSPKRYEYKMSHFKGKTPIQFAQEHHIAQSTSQKEFDFRKTFADVENSINPRVNYVRIAYIQHLFNPSSQSFDLETINKDRFAMFLKPEHKISIDDVKEILASHYQEYGDTDPYKYYKVESTETKFYRSIASLNTSNAHVTIIDNNLSDHDANINNLEYIALGMPTVSFYLPIYYGITKIPDNLQGATDNADEKSEKLFWQFRTLQALVFLSDPSRNIFYNPHEKEQIIQKAYQKLAIEVENKRILMESEYNSMKKRSLIDEFTQDTVSKLSKINQKLIHELMVQLNINKEYNLNNDRERAQWITQKVREQECHFKPQRCRRPNPGTLAFAKFYGIENNFLISSKKKSY